MKSDGISAGRMSHEYDNYHSDQKRIEAFQQSIRSQLSPAKSCFMRWDYINDCPVYITLAEQGLIPAKYKKHGTTSLFERVVRPKDSVVCVFCQSEFSLRNGNPVAEHLSLSGNTSSNQCQLAKKFAGTYPIFISPYYKNNQWYIRNFATGSGKDEDSFSENSCAEFIAELSQVQVESFDELKKAISYFFEDCKDCMCSKSTGKR